MHQGTSTIGRAFQLAKKGVAIDEIRKQLKDEGHFQVDAHLSGRQIKKDLRRVIGENEAAAA